MVIYFFFDKHYLSVDHVKEFPSEKLEVYNSISYLFMFEITSIPKSWRNISLEWELVTILVVFGTNEQNLFYGFACVKEFFSKESKENRFHEAPG